MLTARRTAPAAYVERRQRRHDIALYAQVSAILLDYAFLFFPFAIFCVAPPERMAILTDTPHAEALVGTTAAVAFFVVMIALWRFDRCWQDVSNLSDVLSACGLLWPLWRVACVVLLGLVWLAHIREPGYIWLALFATCVLGYAIGAWFGYARIVKLLK